MMQTRMTKARKILGLDRGTVVKVEYANRADKNAWYGVIGSRTNTHIRLQCYSDDLKIQEKVVPIHYVVLTETHFPSGVLGLMMATAPLYDRQHHDQIYRECARHVTSKKDFDFLVELGCLDILWDRLTIQKLCAGIHLSLKGCEPELNRWMGRRELFDRLPQKKFTAVLTSIKEELFGSYAHMRLLLTHLPLEVLEKALQSSDKGLYDLRVDFLDDSREGLLRRAVFFRKSCDRGVWNNALETMQYCIDRIPQSSHGAWRKVADLFTRTKKHDLSRKADYDSRYWIDPSRLVWWRCEPITSGGSFDP